MDNYRVDFFILSNASGGHNFIYLIDTYIKTPEYSKAVVNSIVSMGLDNDPNDSNN